MFLHDVAMTADVSEPRYTPGFSRIGGQMRYVIFDTAPEAEQFAARYPYLRPSVNYRNWHPTNFHTSRIDDRRGVATRGTC